MDLDAVTRRGQLIVHRDHATDLAGVFGELYASEFPIWQMQLVDAYGAAIDLNPVENPYVTDEVCSPRRAAASSTSTARRGPTRHPG